MKNLYFIILLAYSTFAYSQPTVTKIENFPIGWNLIFRNINPAGISAGKAGANQTWDFSNVALNPDSTTERMVEPAWTPKGADFPSANLVEKYSNGQLVYVNKTDSANYLVGYVGNSTELKYPENIMFSKRSMTYLDSFRNAFTDNYSISGLNFTFRGGGTFREVADGYGTLKLPNRTFNNVLRIKIIQVQHDTTLPAGPVRTTTTVSYVWFDDTHYSALLKIDSTNSGMAFSTDAQYLLQENLSGIDSKKTELANFTASIYSNQLLVGGELKSGEEYNLGLYDMLGREVFQTTFVASGAPEQTFNTFKELKGTYILNMQGNNENAPRIKIIAE